LIFEQNLLWDEELGFKRIRSKKNCNKLRKNCDKIALPSFLDKNGQRVVPIPCNQCVSSQHHALEG
jgi:hypothetical protein